MATYTNDYLLVQPGGANATKETLNNHRRLFVDSRGRYWYLGFTQSGAAAFSDAESIDVWWADDPTGVWTKEILRLKAEFGAAGASDLNACFAEANDGDLVVMLSLTTDTFGAGDAWRVYRRLGNDAVPNWTQQAIPVPDYTANVATLAETNFTLLNHPDDPDVWILISADRPPAVNPVDLVYIRSTDNMATWDAAVVLYAGSASSDTIAENGGLCVATGSANRTLYIFFGGDDSLYFGRLTAWDTAPVFSTPELVHSGSSGANVYGISGAWKGDGSFELFFNKYNGTFANYFIRHRNISNVDGVLVIGADTQLDHTGIQADPPVGAYVDADDEYAFWFKVNADLGLVSPEVGVAESLVTGSQDMCGMSAPNQFALDKDLAGTTGPNGLLRGTFLVTYGLHEDGTQRAYSILTSSTFEINSAPTTVPPTTVSPSTVSPSTPVPPTTPAPPTTIPPTLAPSPGLIVASYGFRRGLRQLVVRATTADSENVLTEDPLDPEGCTAELFDESGSLGVVTGEPDPAGSHYVFFVIPDVDKAPGMAYALKVSLRRASTAQVGTRLFALATT
jgi:hypothetical protein